ncbi:MAG: TIM-barrel domain-containing protein [Bacteroidota bacterium]
MLKFHEHSDYYQLYSIRHVASSIDTEKATVCHSDGYRCFTWNPDRFPQPENLIEDLKRDGFHTVVIIDPGIKIDHEYDIFQQGLEGSHYLRRPDGQYAQGKVWPGWCYFPDYTRPATREWWSGLFRDLMLKQKIAGVWNDMNEPALFDVDSKTMPDDVRHDYDGHSSSHRKAHNVYGMQMARATQQGVKHYAYPNRPFMITRATFSGGQRYSSVWTGDNNANWEHLQLANTQCQRLSVSGFSHCGTDIGGFNDQPDGELFVRWLQTGIFHPLCRVHSIGFHDVGDAAVDEEAVAEHEASAETRDQEPWSFGEPYTEISRKTIELRYQLMPYLYTAFWQYVQKGTPVLKPLSFVDQHDPETHHRMEEFVVGDHLLIAPISEQGAKGRYLYLPKGLWYDFRDDRPILGEQEIWTDASLEEIPMYIQAGAVFPMAPVMQYTGEFVVETLDLHVYFTQGEQSTQLYEDAGEGYDYQEGQARIHQFDLLGEVTSLRLTHRVEGKFPQAYRKFRLTFHGMPFGIQSTVVDGERVSVDKREKLPSVVVSADFLELHLL